MSVLSADLKLFKETDFAYINFIAELTTSLTEPGELYDGIKVSKRKSGYTIVIIKHEKTEVSLVYRNRDLYIIGIIVGEVCYMDKKAYSEVSNKQELNNVISPARAESLSTEFSYHFILPKGEQTEIRFGDLEFDLQKLTQIEDQMKRKDVMKNNFSPFVILFAEAIRFPAIAKLAQQAFRSVDGKLKLSTDVAPSNIVADGKVIKIHTLLLIWGKLSSCVKNLHQNQDCTVTVEIRHNPTPEHPNGLTLPEAININKETLRNLLGVANSYSFDKFEVIKPSKAKATKARGKRNALYKPLQPIQQRLALSNNQKNLLEYDGTVQQSSAAVLHNVINNIDLTGALQLLTLAILHFTKKQFHQTELETSAYNSREASAVAADISERVVRFMQCSGLSRDEIEYENQMQLQRLLAAALFRGEKIDEILSNFIAEYGVRGIEDQSAKEMLYQAVIDGTCFV